jgi:hypothetical protein
VRGLPKHYSGQRELNRVFLLAFGIWAVMTVQHRQALWEPIPGGTVATGTVTSVHEDCNRGGCTYQPTIEYADLGGRLHTFTAPHQGDGPAVDSKVRVSYDPRVPGDAHDISMSPSSLNFQLGFAISAIAVAGLVLLVYAGVCLLILYRRGTNVRSVINSVRRWMARHV